MKKSIIAILSAITLVVVGIVVYLCIPKEKPIELTLEAEDINLSVGTNAEIVYSCSIDDAIITIESENAEIARVFISANKYKVEGVKVGETTFTIKAKYKDNKVEKEISVVVSDIQHGNEGGDNEPDTPIEEPDDNPNEVPEVGPTPDEDIDIDFVNLTNITITDDILYVKVNKTAFFSITCSSNIESLNVTSDNENLVVTYLQDIGNNTYSMKAKVSGNYQIKVIINGTEFSFSVVAE